MQIIRTIIWVLIAVILVLFAVTNWTPVTISLWGGSVLDTWLPLVVMASFLTGLVPVWFLHVATKWRMSRKLANAERALASATSAVSVASASVASPSAVAPTNSSSSPAPLDPA